MIEKRTMRKLLSSFLILAVLAGTVLASDTMSISGERTQAAPGDIITYAVSITNNTGVAGFLVYVQCDTDVFSLVKDDDGEYTVSSSDFSRSGTVMANRYGEDGWQILWFNAQNVKTNGTLFTLQMKVRENAASGSYPIHISYSPKDTVTEDGVQTPLTCVNGSVEVQGMSAEKADSETPVQNGADGGTGAFPDVPKTHWAYLYIQGLAEKKIVSGDRSGRFHPESSVTRAQFVKMLAGVMGADLSNYARTKFSDVSDGSWAAPYIAWAAENGIVNGTGETTFSPDAPITREQIAATVQRCAEGFGIALRADADAKAFTDQSQISGYAQAAVSQMAQAGILGGYADGTFRPKSHASRAEAAKILAGIFEIVLEGKK